MLANRLAVYKKRYKKKRKGIPEDTAGLYIRIQQPGQTLGGEKKKPMKQLDPPAILIWNLPLLIGCLDLQNGCTLKPLLFSPIPLQCR
jgi:hypothetical protein